MHKTATDTRVRVSLVTLRRLRDAAARYQVSISEIMRRASTAALRRNVCLLPDRMPGPTQPVQPLGLSEHIHPNAYGFLAEWYLDNYDRGGELVRPMTKEEIREAAGCVLYALDIPKAYDHINQPEEDTEQ